MVLSSTGDAGGLATPGKGVIAASRHLQQPTHQTHGPSLPQRADHFEERSISLTKKAVDFFSISRSRSSCFARASSSRMRRWSLWTCASLRGGSACWARHCATQHRSAVSPTPSASQAFEMTSPVQLHRFGLEFVSQVPSAHLSPQLENYPLSRCPRTLDHYKGVSDELWIERSDPPLLIRQTTRFALTTGKHRRKEPVCLESRQSYGARVDSRIIPLPVMMLVPASPEPVSQPMIAAIQCEIGG